MFSVGMLVVFVGGLKLEGPMPKGANLSLRSIYTIRAIVTDPTWTDCVGLLLEEIINPINDDPRWLAEEVSYDSRGFRPVRETSIEIFREAVKHLPKEIETV